MKTIERFSFVFFVAGFGLFGFSVLVQAGLPLMVLRNIPMATIEEISQNIDPAFDDIARRWPVTFKKYYGDNPTPENYAKALDLGRKIYTQEACWHCHSQFVRPISNEAARWGKVSYASEYQNELQLPPLLGTRRVGPDLARQAWVHSNDWHAAHFWNPPEVVPLSVMPRFPWFFDKVQRKEEDGSLALDEKGQPIVDILPNEKGIAIIAYVQWLGSWIPEEDRPDGAGLAAISTELLDLNRGKVLDESAFEAAGAAPAAAPAAAKDVSEDRAPVEEAPAAAPAPKATLDDIPIRTEPWATEDKLDKPWTVGIE